MNPSANDGQPAPAESGDAGPAPSRWRRLPSLTALVVLGVVVAAADVWFRAAGDGKDESTIGAGVKPPACAEPGIRDLVQPERGSAFRSKMPECFRSADDLVSFAADRSDGTTSIILVPVDIPLTPGESVTSLIRVSAVEVGKGAVAQSSQQIEEQIRRGLGITDSASVTMVRRTVDGARGWGFHVDSPEQTLVAWVFLKGTTQLSVVCRWVGEDLEARMLAGCNQIVDTLTVA